MRLPAGVDRGRGVQLGRGVRFDLADGGRVVLADGARIGDRCRFHVRGGEVRIGAGTILDERCVIAAEAGVTVGARCRLADGVVLIDFDHRFEDAETPIRLQGTVAEPIAVGDEVTLAPGVAVLRGVRIGEGALVTAHAVVTRDVPPGAEVGGVPARRT